MKKRKICTLVLIVALIATYFPTAALASEMDATFTVTTSSDQVAVGETVTAILSTTEIVACRGYQATMEYDSSKLEYVGLESGISDDVVFNEEGHEIIALTEYKNATKVDANSYLMIVKFKAISKGKARIALKDVEATNSDGILNIDATSTKNVTITLPSSTIAIKDSYNGNKTYDGLQVAYPEESDMEIKGSQNTRTFLYAKDENGKPSEDTESSRPKDAGDYWIYAAVASDDNFEGAISEPKKFTIARADYVVNEGLLHLSTNKFIGDAYPSDMAAAAEGVHLQGAIAETVKGTIKWYKDAECQESAANGTFDKEGQTALYYIFTPGASETNYVTEPKTGSVEFTVSKLPAQTFTGEFGRQITKTYGNDEFTETASTEQGGTVTYTSSNENVAVVDVNSGKVTINGAGSTTITATASEVIKDGKKYAETTKSYELVVAPKTLTAADLERNDSAAVTKIYDGNDIAEGITYKVKDSSKVKVEDSIAISGSAKYNSKDVATANKITFTPNAITEGNYRLASAETVEITGASITTKPITATVDEVHRNYLAGNPNFTATVDSKELAVGDNYDALGLTFATTATAASDAGQYDVTKVGCTNTNYDVTVNGANKLIVDKIAPNLEDLDVSIPGTVSYNAKERIATVAPKAGVKGLGTITVKYNEKQTAPINVGDYAVTADIAEGTNYTATTFNLGSLTINKVELTLSASVDAKIYDCETNAVIKPGTLEGVMAEDEGSVAVKETSVTGKFASADVNNEITVIADAEFTLVGEKAENYKLSQPENLKGKIKHADYTYIVKETQDFTVGKGLDVIQVAPQSGKGVKNETVKGTLKWFSDSARTVEAKDSDLSNLNVDDTKELYWRFTPASTETNYISTPKEGITTFKATGKNDVSDKISFENGELTYNGKGQTFERAKITGNYSGKLNYHYAAVTGSLDESGKPMNAGKYTVTTRYEDADNFGEKMVTLTINPKEIAAPAEDKTVYTYNGNEQTYKVNATEDYTVSGNVQTNANENGYTVEIALRDTDNTVWADTKTADNKTFTFVIKKATPTGTPACTKITEEKKTLADAVLTIGTVKPDAAGYSFKWVDDNDNELAGTTIVDKNKAYKWLFTPADTANYNTLSGTLTPYYASGNGGSGYAPLPTVQKPEIKTSEGGKVSLGADGTTATITPDEGKVIDKVILNGKDMGTVTEIKGLKTGDKVEVTFKDKVTEPNKTELDQKAADAVKALKLKARSSKLKNGNIKIIVTGDLSEIENIGCTVKYKFYRSTKKSAGYKAMLTKDEPSYRNTTGKKGKMYYYKARVMIYDQDGQLVVQSALKQCKYANRRWSK